MPPKFIARLVLLVLLGCSWGACYATPPAETADLRSEVDVHFDLLTAENATPPNVPEVTEKSNARLARRHWEGWLRALHQKALDITPGKGAQVHHAIELQVLDKYPGAFSADKLNDISNMRGIVPEKEGRRQLHNSVIRLSWNAAYEQLDLELSSKSLARGSDEYNRLVRTRLGQAREYIDWRFGAFFSEQRAAYRRGDFKFSYSMLRQPRGVWLARGATTITGVVVMMFAENALAAEYENALLPLPPADLDGVTSAYELLKDEKRLTTSFTLSKRLAEQLDEANTAIWNDYASEISNINLELLARSMAGDDKSAELFDLLEDSKPKLQESERLRETMRRNLQPLVQNDAASLTDAAAAARELASLFQNNALKGIVVEGTGVNAIEEFPRIAGRLKDYAKLIEKIRSSALTLESSLDEQQTGLQVMDTQLTDIYWSIVGPNLLAKYVEVSGFVDDWEKRHAVTQPAANPGLPTLADTLKRLRLDVNIARRDLQLEQMSVLQLESSVQLLDDDVWKKYWEESNQWDEETAKPNAATTWRERLADFQRQQDEMEANRLRIRAEIDQMTHEAERIFSASSARASPDWNRIQANHTQFIAQMNERQAAMVARLQEYGRASLAEAHLTAMNQFRELTDRQHARAMQRVDVATQRLSDTETAYRQLATARTGRPATAASMEALRGSSTSSSARDIGLSRPAPRVERRIGPGVGGGTGATGETGTASASAGVNAGSLPGSRSASSAAPGKGGVASPSQGSSTSSSNPGSAQSGVLRSGVLDKSVTTDSGAVMGYLCVSGKPCELVDVRGE